MTLFDINKKETLQKNAPLAQRMRPQTLDEILGQTHIIGPASCCAGPLKPISFHR